jgi:hypothetical protein
LSLPALGILLAATLPAAADCQSEVNAAFDKLRQSRAFRVRTTIVNENGSLKMTVDYVLPDRMHQKVSVSSGAGPVELIVIGGRAWSNNGQGWAEMPTTFAEHVAGQIKQSIVEPPLETASFACLGDKELEGKAYAAYRAVIAVATGQSGPGASRSSLQTVYVDKATGLPERNIVTADSGSDERLFDGTFSFPQELSIEPPVARATP